MAIPEMKVYPRSGDKETIYLQNVITHPNIRVGDYTIYNDFVNDPRLFEKNNVLYHYPINHDTLVIGKFCSIACGAKFLLNSANHTMSSLSTYPFPLFFEEWNLNIKDVSTSWDHKGDIVIGNVSEYVACCSFSKLTSFNIALFNSSSDTFVLYISTLLTALIPANSIPDLSKIEPLTESILLILESLVLDCCL